MSEKRKVEYARVKTLREAGLTWEQIGRKVGVSANVVTEVFQAKKDRDVRAYKPRQKVAAKVTLKASTSKRVVPAALVSRFTWIADGYLNGMIDADAMSDMVLDLAGLLEDVRKKK